jgi:hypothetical protein
MKGMTTRAVSQCPLRKLLMKRLSILLPGLKRRRKSLAHS